MRWQQGGKFRVMHPCLTKPVSLPAACKLDAPIRLCYNSRSVESFANDADDADFSSTMLSVIRVIRG